MNSPSGHSSTDLNPAIAGLLCYVLGWITGLIFLIIEKRNGFVRFHAAQSIVVFGTITVLGMVLPHVPFLGGLLSVLLSAISFILWLVLMITAAQGKTLKLPIAGDFAEQLARG